MKLSITEANHKWMFYRKIREILYNKPEINPVATCSNLKGRYVKPTQNKSTGTNCKIIL